MTTTGVLVVALMAVGAASGKAPAPPLNVACSQQALVDAINAANSAGGGTLNLARRCDYQLTVSPDDSENGLPPITTSITINGNQATIDGTNSFRDLEVDGPGGNLSAQDMTFTGGLADVGGAIANFAGVVTLDRAQVTGNSADGGGGGIANASINPDFSPSSTVATLAVRHSSVSGNQQTGGPDDPNAGGGGGIINLDGTATIDHSQVSANTAQGFFGGGIASGDYFGFGGDTVLTVDHSQVDGNMAPNAGGGGIQNLLGMATVDHSQVDGNTSLNGGGISSGNQGDPTRTAELKLSHSEVDGNTATAGPGGEGPPIAGGGLANGSDAVIVHSRIDGNHAPNGIGAGIVNHGMMALHHSRVDHNTAAASGIAGSAGGILNVEGPPGTTPAVLTIDHSKVNDNTAGGDGGGIANGLPLPGPMPFPGGAITLTNSEVRHNSAAHGGGIFNHGGTVSLSQSSVTDNQVDNCEPTNTIAGCIN